ncbi:PTS sorbose transporter subunit IIC [Acetohalobium arabaticum]|uniref:Phosphotransferase system PTS sorbose-specific IIC subunit n=1 Tax=Acetohalobium arabaticum (strain ATCC 49924 / DSM 5501 / Z-7288) TaxID=574087 RepID=D9QU69_ACEAZ|nr:PTS sorbose transporter subunit IIC [Acetohalobium arabaticum]ADL11862.1 phosphotransferase system PTS sorbose-specific IIC subunit [Acetohalobium arabaticum DSM 5501]
MIKLFSLALLINSINFLERRLKCSSYRYLLHPILVAPLGGALLGNLSTGIYIGLLLEVIWGSNLFDYDFGLQYVNLAAILTTVLTLVTGNISLILNLTIAVIITYLLQEAIIMLDSKTNQWIIEIGLFFFIFTLLNFTPVLKGLLGEIPAQFLDQLAVASGLLPGLGLAVILAQIIVSEDLGSNLKLSYLLVLVILLLLSQWFNWLLPVLFIVIWGGGYLLVKKFKVSSYFLRLAIGGLVIAAAPLVVEITGPMVDSQLKLVLWSEAFLSVSTLGLLLFRITQFELYFICLILGVIASRAGLLL